MTDSALESGAVMIGTMTHKQGFTLIELLVTLAVASMVLFVGVPSMSTMIANNQKVTATNDLVLALNFSRSHALKTGKHVSLCPSKDGVTCVSGSADWAYGWIVFANKAFNTVSTREESEEIVRVFAPIEGGINLTTEGNIDSYVSFRPTGDSDFQGSWVFCDKRGTDFAGAVSLYRSGRSSTTKTLWDDTALNCGSGP